MYSLNTDGKVVQQQVVDVDTLLERYNNCVQAIADYTKARDAIVTQLTQIGTDVPSVQPTLSVVPEVAAALTIIPTPAITPAII